MGDITKNIRTHRIIFKDNRDDIAITSEQYRTLSLAKEDRKSTEFIKVRDPDTGRILFEGELGKIAEFKEVETISGSDIRWICDFGSRHHLTIECDCSKKIYNGFPSFYVLPALNYLGFNIGCNSDITKIMREKLFKSTKDINFKNKVIEYYQNRFN